MGKKVTFIRRKRECQCFNPQIIEKRIKTEFCECTEEDWECDLGFSRASDGPCKASNGVEIDYNPDLEQCSLSKYYFVTQGYRRIAGNKC